MNRKTMVGMLLLGALIIFALATFYIENWSFYLRKGYELEANFETGQTLEEGDEVRVTGVKVGRVAGLEVDTEALRAQPVRVVMQIEKGIKVRAKDVARIETKSVFGGSFISISRGDTAAPVLKDGETMQNTKVEPSITDVVAKADYALDQVGQAAENLKGTVDSAKKAFDGIEKLTKDVTEGKGLMARLMTDEKMAADAQGIFDSLKRLSADLEAGKGFAGKLLTDEKLYDDLKSAVSEASGAFEKIKDFAEKASEGKGLLAKLISDEKLANDVSQFASSLGKISGNLENSTFGKLASSDEAYRKLNELLDSLNESAKAISEGKGTVGKLVKDDQLYNKVGGAVDTVQKLLDDYREQSPVISFVGALFGAF